MEFNELAVNKLKHNEFRDFSEPKAPRSLPPLKSHPEKDLKDLDSWSGQKEKSLLNFYQLTTGAAQRAMKSVISVDNAVLK